MLNLNSRTLIATLATFSLLAACGEQDPVSNLTANASAGGANPVVLRASGSGHVTTPLPLGASEVGWRTMSFTATQRLDGSVQGHAQYNQRTQGGIIQHGDAICMADAGDGWVILGFESTKRISEVFSSPVLGLPAATPDNHAFFFAVQDNGEGAGAPDDRMTGAVHTLVPVVRAICNNPAGFGFVPAVANAFSLGIEAGNIQVKY